MGQSEFLETKVLTPVKTNDDGHSGYSVILETIEGGSYVMFGIDELVYMNLVSLINGYREEVNEVYQLMLDRLAEEEKKTNTEIIGLQIEDYGENRGRALLLLKDNYRRRIPYGTGLVLATMKKWPIFYTESKMVKIDCKELKQISSLVRAKQNPMDAINVALLENIFKTS